MWHIDRLELLAWTRFGGAVKLITIFFLLVLAALPLRAQTPAPKQAHAANAPLAVDACEILAHPSRYNGKLVKARGNFRRTAKWSGIEKVNCSDEILVVDPADPSVTPPANFQIQDDAAYKSFKKSSEELKPGDAATQFEANLRYKYEVSATFTGRLDSADIRLPSGKIQSLPGFGPQEMFRARLVLKSVSAVVATPR
jgi:hypothetical protein